MDFSLKFLILIGFKKEKIIERRKGEIYRERLRTIINLCKRNVANKLP